HLYCNYCNTRVHHLDPATLRLFSRLSLESLLTIQLRQVIFSAQELSQCQAGKARDHKEAVMVHARNVTGAPTVFRKQASPFSFLLHQTHLPPAICSVG